jgi:hypothetical protein
MRQMLSFLLLLLEKLKKNELNIVFDIKKVAEPPQLSKK